MIRVAQFRAEMARDANDAAVINACVRVREGWLLGRKVARADLELIEAFA